MKAITSDDAKSPQTNTPIQLYIQTIQKLFLSSSSKYKMTNTTTEHTAGSRLVVKKFDVASLVNEPSGRQVWVINNVVNNLYTHKRIRSYLHSWHSALTLLTSLYSTRMWANAQRDGRRAEYRWRPLFNAAKFGWRPLLECRSVMLPICETPWNLLGCPKLPNRFQLLVGQSSPYCGDMWRTYCCLTSFFSDCQYMP